MGKRGLPSLKIKKFQNHIVCLHISLWHCFTIILFELKYKTGWAIEPFCLPPSSPSVAKPDELGLRSHCCGRITFQSWWK